ncbi:hypothetical protein E2553_34360 [Paraburkholderia dipogonis]|uniref:Uncharacterized protein n=1 Tax=Paraburkholderia dipogonis TaxID=1211383 RepID=A0A4Y8MWI4_9BURK|nr:hypothetical protein [Paraburkholderia dipogonis]TFE41735.1 hypothetical protein E2553_34360 [Paraburkholderia dipogonis]
MRDGNQAAADCLEPEGNSGMLSARQQQGEHTDYDRPRKKRQTWAWAATKEQYDWMDSHASFVHLD